MSGDDGSFGRKSSGAAEPVSAPASPPISELPPILTGKAHDAASVFAPEALLREARRQKGLARGPVPEICVLDPDGDIVRRLKQAGAARPSTGWACYHTELVEFELAGRTLGAVGRAVGAPFAVLVAEQFFASGGRFLISLTSAGQIADLGRPPYFVVIDRALRDEGTSYHYLPPSDFAEGRPELVARAFAAIADTGLAVHRGSSWTTDAPFRETSVAIDQARLRRVLAVEMEAAALYAFAEARGREVLCLAHVTNSMGQDEGDFEKGEVDGTEIALRVLEAVVARVGSVILENVDAVATSTRPRFQ